MPKAKDPLQIAQWSALSREAEGRGVPLTVGELTNLPSLKVMERNLRRFPRPPTR
ncbi:hypothetical protein [Azospirillum sp. SYSU D00513]|uniref:hypothetical protein n=1 Tax=Azospirillum sp. SYSU D00513 TaxID=2812561 RepID=UPI001A96D159|nr:hypothetical protein [Azospirillum sp. SYSU D00513]